MNDVFAVICDTGDGATINKFKDFDKAHSYYSSNVGLPQYYSVKFIEYVSGNIEDFYLIEEWYKEN